MPYPNEHACRLHDPGKYDTLRRKNCDEKVDGKCIDVIYGITDNKSEIQALRYDRDVWTEGEAHKHCDGRGGTFEAAKGADDVAAKSIEGKLVKRADTYGIMASTGDKDRDGEIVAPAAFKNLKQYLGTNPVILFGHQYDQPPIAKATDGKVLDNGLRLDIEFAETPFAKEVKYLYDNGFMNSFSIGFIPKDWEVDKNGTRVYTDVELLEVSAVPVPANAAATMIRQAKSRGVELCELERVLGSNPESNPDEGETAANEKASLASVADRYERKRRWTRLNF